MTIELADLPSKGKHYAASNIEIRPITVAEIKKFSKTRVSGDWTYFVDGILDCVRLDGKKPKASGFFICDFFPIVAEIRFLSLKEPIVAEWICDGTVYLVEGLAGKQTAKSLREYYDHYQGLGDDEKADALNPDEMLAQSVGCLTQNTVQLTREDFTILPLPDFQDDFDQEIFAVPTVDLLADLVKAQQSPSLADLLGAAQWLRDGVGIEEKIAILENQDTIDVFDRASKINIRYAAGIATLAERNCKSCDKQRLLRVVWGPDLFFRG